MSDTGLWALVLIYRGLRCYSRKGYMFVNDNDVTNGIIGSRESDWLKLEGEGLISKRGSDWWYLLPRGLWFVELRYWYIVEKWLLEDGIYYITPNKDEGYYMALMRLRDDMGEDEWLNRFNVWATQ